MEVIIDHPQAFLIRAFFALVSFSLFVEWKRRDALMMFQAWALFAFVLNLTLTYDAIFNLIGKNGKLLIGVCFTINSFVVIYKSWKMSDQFISKSKSKKLSNQSIIESVFQTVKTRIFAFLLLVKGGGSQRDKDFAHQLNTRVQV